MAQLTPEVGYKLGYTYDFGDNWQLSLTVEKILTLPPARTVYPRCSAGRRNGPAEDSDGPAGYNELLRALRARKGYRYREAREQHGRYDPEAFDLAGINTQVARL